MDAAGFEKNSNHSFFLLLKKKSIFAIRKMNRILRHIAPFVLLASYLPMAALSSFHVHHETIDAPDDCLQCVGHIETAHHHDHDCLFCTFLSLNYLISDQGQPAAILSVTEQISTPAPTRVLQFHYGVSQLRAPPTV